MILSPASLLLVASFGVLIASEVVEVDFLFPRNETYAPAEWFPVVFAFPNAKPPQILKSSLSYRLWNTDNMTGLDPESFTYDLLWSNWSRHDTYFAYHIFHNKFATEGRWRVTWNFAWESCEGDEIRFEDYGRFIHNYSAWGTSFTIKNSAQKVDLTSATTTNRTCPGDQAVAINATGQTMTSHYDTSCGVVDSSNPAPMADRCRVKVDSTTVERMSADWKERLCRNGRDTSIDCPKEENSAANRLVVIARSCSLAALGAFGFIF
ncbi:hypothetical protein P170DRAFT_384932, partial [Aspergillus steynii IBT 23096]